MIWTTPLGAELGPLPVVELSPVLQARSLSIACAYLRSLDVQAALALTGNQCPGGWSLGGVRWPSWLFRWVGFTCLATSVQVGRVWGLRPCPGGWATSVQVGRGL